MTTMTARTRYASISAGQKISLPNILLCLVLLLSYSCAQSTSDRTSMAPTWSITMATSSILITSPTSTVRSISWTTIDSAPSSTSNTTSSSSSPTTKQTPSDIFSAATSPDDTSTPNNPVFNYYFLFLALFGVLVAVLLWWIHREKKRRKELTRLSGQNALARDLEGWTNTRRFMHGRYNRNHRTAFIRGEEGFDEHGEAPPPYQPKSDMTKAQESSQAAQDAAGLLTIPLGALPRDEIERARPPAYCNTS